MDNSQIEQPVQKKNPTELLFEQTQSLSVLVELQRQQNVQITELKHQNERMIESLVGLQRANNNISGVKIENINMPFVSLIGFMLKVSIASIPAAIILALLYAVVVAIFGGILTGCT